MAKQYSFQNLLDVIETLRGPKGCPWDKKQTHITIRENLIEEVYEFIDTINTQNTTHMEEELGDILLQILFHTQIEKEKGNFTINDVIDTLTKKLIRRHPHVFGNKQVSTIEEVKTNWEDIKSKEKGQTERKRLMDKISHSLPALPKSMKILDIAYNSGFSWKNIEKIWEKFYEEKKEFESDIEASKSSFDLEAEFGDMLFVLLVIAKHYHIDAESALNKTNKKFIQRFNYMENQLQQAGKQIKDLSADKLINLWNEAKKSNF